MSPIEAKAESTPLAFGHSLLQHFSLDPTWRNLNHGSFGASPTAIIAKMHGYQARCEARPDPFLRYELPVLLAENRAAVAKVVNAPVNTVVLVQNATMAFNVILRNLTWGKNASSLEQNTSELKLDGALNDGQSSKKFLQDEILYFSTIYGGCGKTVAYVTDSATDPATVCSREIPLTYPISNQTILSLFHTAVSTSRSQGKHPRLCVIDAISSLPGVRFPYEALVAACRAEGILSLVDAAQGVGMIPFDLQKLDPDFWLSNAHKWLFVPRGCAVLYVPVRNQGMIRSTVPTSHWYEPLPKPGQVSAQVSVLPQDVGGKSKFEKMFDFTGTMETSQYLCIKDAVEWREKMLGGEERIMAYTSTLAREGGARAAAILGTEVMDNEEKTLIDGAMVNVALPMLVLNEDGSDLVAKESDVVVRKDDSMAVWEWMNHTLVKEYSTFVPLYVHNGRFWVRISAQVYLEMGDFEWAAKTLDELCRRVGAGEWKKTDK